MTQNHGMQQKQFQEESLKKKLLRGKEESKKLA